MIRVYNDPAASLNIALCLNTIKRNISDLGMIRECSKASQIIQMLPNLLLLAEERKPSWTTNPIVLQGLNWNAMTDERN